MADKPRPRLGDLATYQRLPEQGWRLGLVCGIGATVSVRELGQVKETPTHPDARLLVCRTIIRKPTLVKRYAAAEKPFPNLDAVRAFVIDHVPPEVAQRS